MAAQTPVLIFPESTQFSTNMDAVQLIGTAALGTISVEVDGNAATLTGTSWTYSLTLQTGDNNVEIVAYDSPTGNASLGLFLIITKTTDTELGLIVDPPSGLSVRRNFDAITLINIASLQAEVIGYNYYVSEVAGGGLEGYRQLNTSLVTEPYSVVEQTTEELISETQTGNVRTRCVNITINNLVKYAFRHNRGDDTLVTLPDTENLYYVITAIAKQPDGTLVESPYSAEIAARPIVLQTALQQLPVRTQADVALSYIARIVSADDIIDVKPLTFTRDVVIDPPSEEFQRLYLILDFINRSQSFLTLLEIDDADGDEESDPVLDSAYKNALRVALLVDEKDASVIQGLIDTAFTKLAKNSQVDRKPAEYSAGEITLYATRLPATDRVIAERGAMVETESSAGDKPVRFEVLSQLNFYKATASNYYNNELSRYEYRVRVSAVETGEQGNVEAGAIKVPVSGTDPLFRIENEAATYYGGDIEGNVSLAERAMLAFVSVDSGTAPGYLARLLGISGIYQVRIQQGGTPYMKRDYDPLRGMHIGGKVDAYIQSLKQSTVSDVFSFSFKKVERELLRIKSLSGMEFSIQNVEVSENSPVFEVIEVYNASKTNTYDLNGVQILGNGNVVNLDENLSKNIALGLDADDVVYGTYRFRQGSQFKFRNQPVVSVQGVVGNLSGALPAENYQLIKKDDPLDVGNSARANDALEILFVGGLPLSDFEVVVDEAVFLVGETRVELVKYGAIQSTIVVQNASKSVTYAVAVDYVLVEGAMSSDKLQIYRKESGAIPSGVTVLVSYSAGENFTVTYTYDEAVSRAQTEIEIFKHATADALVKQTLLTIVDISATVVLEKGANRSVVNSLVRTNVSRLIAPLKIGINLYPSDVISVMDQTPGVGYVDVPMTKMVRGDGSLVVRETLSSPEWVILQTGVKTSYVSQGTLEFKTTDGGGPSTLHRGVFEDDVALTLVSNPNSVSLASGQAYINADGTLVVTSRNDDNPGDHIYTVSYIVEGESGQKPITVSEIEKVVLGQLDLTFFNPDEQRTQ